MIEEKTFLNLYNDELRKYSIEYFLLNYNLFLKKLFVRYRISEEYESRRCLVIIAYSKYIYILFLSLKKEDIRFGITSYEKILGNNTCEKERKKFETMVLNISNCIFSFEGLKKNKEISCIVDSLNASQSHIQEELDQTNVEFVDSILREALEQNVEKQVDVQLKNIVEDFHNFSNEHEGKFNPSHNISDKGSIMDITDFNFNISKDPELTSFDYFYSLRAIKVEGIIYNINVFNNRITMRRIYEELKNVSPNFIGEVFENVICNKMKAYSKDNKVSYRKSPMTKRSEISDILLNFSEFSICIEIKSFDYRDYGSSTHENFSIKIDKAVKQLNRIDTDYNKILEDSHQAHTRKFKVLVCLRLPSVGYKKPDGICFLDISMFEVLFRQSINYIFDKLTHLEKNYDISIGS